MPFYGYKLNSSETTEFNFLFFDFLSEYTYSFYSGVSSVTYHPFNNPETDDPAPSPLRGYYFNGSQFFHSQNFSIAPNNSFSM